MRLRSPWRGAMSLADEKHTCNWDQCGHGWKPWRPSSSHIAAAGPPERVAPRAEPTLKRWVSNACSCKMRSSWYRGLLNQCSHPSCKTCLHCFAVSWDLTSKGILICDCDQRCGCFLLIISRNAWLLEVASWQDWGTRVEHPATRINGYGFHPVSLNISSSRWQLGFCGRQHEHVQELSKAWGSN